MSRASSKMLGPILLALTIVGALVAWEAFASKSVVFFFSKPSEITITLARTISSGQAWNDFSATFGMTLAGLSLGVLLGAVIGAAALSLPSIRPMLTVLLASAAAFPVLAVAPMFMLWFGVGPALKVALATLLSSFIVSLVVIRSPAAVDALLLEAARANSYKAGAIIFKIILPQSTKGVLERAPDAANAAFLGVFVGEFIAADRGVGYRILRAGSLYQVDVVWAYALITVIALVLLQGLVWSCRLSIVSIVERLSVAQPLRNFSKRDD